MSQIKTVTVGETQYNIAQAPAVEQKRLLSLVGGGIMLRALQMSGEFDARNMFGFLVVTPSETVDQIAAIVLKKTIPMGGSSAVTVGDFQGRMVEYFTLVGEGIRANLEDFFGFLASSKAEAAQETMRGQ